MNFSKRFVVFFFLLVFSISSLSLHADTTEEDFFAFYDDFGSIVLLINPEDGTIAYANRAALRFYGYTYGEITTMTINQINILTPEEIAAEMALAEELERNFFEFRHRIRDGSIRDVHVYSYPIVLGDTTYLFSIIHDVTEQVRLADLNRTYQYLLLGIGMTLLVSVLLFGWNQYWKAKELFKKNQQIMNFDILRQTFIDEQTELVYLKDQNLRYVFVNTAVEKFYARDKAEIIGQTDDDLNQAEYFTKRKQETDLAVLTSQQRKIFEVRFDGRVFEATKFPVLMTDGSFGVGAIIRDMTKEKEQREKERKTMLRIHVATDILTKPFSSIASQIEFATMELVKIIECEHALVYQVNPQTGLFETTYTTLKKQTFEHLLSQNPFDLNQPNNPYRSVVTLLEPWIENHYEHYFANPQGFLSIRQFAMIPIVIDSQIQSIILLLNKIEGFSEYDVNQVNLLMNATWNVIRQKELSQSLSSERRNYLQTLLSIGDGVVVVNQLGIIEVFNPTAATLCGWLEEEALGLPFEQVLQFVDAHNQTLISPIQTIIDQPKELAHERMILVARNGKHTHIEAKATPLFNEEGDAQGVVLVLRDISQVILQEQSIEYALNHDPLTKLYNRYYFERLYKHPIPLNQYPITVLFCDVNGLKFTNDVFGHQQGDELLLRAVQVIQAEAPKQSVICRYGGDEFILLVPLLSDELAYQLKKRIKEAFSKQEICGLKGSISIGYQTTMSPVESIETLLNEAENYMYREKALEHDAFTKQSIPAILDRLYHAVPSEKRHSQVVANLAKEFAGYLELDAIDQDRLYHAGLYHDIGKATWPKTLFDKSTRLSENEWTLIKQHPLVSYRILHAIAEYVDIADIVLSHHERQDGLGYPKGLQAHQINKLSKILAIVESYDAMTSLRSYRPTLSFDEAMQELLKVSGTQLDPVYVIPFISFMKAKKVSSR